MSAVMCHRVSYCACAFEKILEPTTAEKGYREVQSVYERKELVCLFLAQQHPVGHGLLLHEVSTSHTRTHHSRLDSSGRVISPSQRPLPDNTQHSQQTDIYASGGTRTRNPSKRAAAEGGRREPP